MPAAAATWAPLSEETLLRLLPARSSSAVEKQAEQRVWMLKKSEARPREVFERSREASG
jgi:hypothetical protein